MTQNITQLKDELTAQIAAANDLQSLEEARIAALGKKGRITGLMKGLAQMAPEERKDFGAAVNALKDEVAALIDRQEAALKKQAMHEKLAAETIDVTLPVRPQAKGTIHPLSHTMDEMLAIFGSMGFELAEGPDIEDDWHNFTALNFPPGHPAREMHDTFFLPEDAEEQGELAKKLLRTHTSTVQIRHMENNKPPIKIICMGRVYRYEAIDATHLPMFHQIEGLYIDRNVNMGHLKGCLLDFCRAFFEVDDLPVQLRPSFFPFVEPGAEMGIGYIRDEKGFRIGKAENPMDQKWLEILGCGMVHPNVLRSCGIDPDEYQGFAFGAGLDRLAMLKYGLSDLRSLIDADTRWSRHYGFDPLDRPSRATAAKG
ncbi:MAG: phenylalanine--tRNA ligase subunit alpha [Micavibrio sp.]